MTSSRSAQFSRGATCHEVRAMPMRINSNGMPRHRQRLVEILRQQVMFGELL